VVCSATPALDGMADAEAEITLETYDKHHVKVPKSIATRSAIINMMIEGARLCVSLCIAPRGAAVGEGAGLLQLFQFDRFPPFTARQLTPCLRRHRGYQRGRAARRQELHIEHHQPRGGVPQEARGV
jgi:hypothetical protein